jgi:hypothetical protein
MLRSDDSAFSTGSPFTRWGLLALALAAGALALGCTPQIGDKCTVSTNCSSTGDRLCDVTQPDGYCTKFNCEPGQCPDNSVCVNFGTTLSPVSLACSPSQANSPYKRSFCMADCSDDSDCRDGYKCQAPTEFYAVLAEHSSGTRVCAVPPKPLPKGTSDEVCIGSDEGVGPAEGGSSSGGGSGAGQGGAAGDAGAGGSSGTGQGGAAGDAGAGG